MMLHPRKSFPVLLLMLCLAQVALADKLSIVFERTIVAKTRGDVYGASIMPDGGLAFCGMDGAYRAWVVLLSTKGDVTKNILAENDVITEKGNWGPREECHAVLSSGAQSTVFAGSTNSRAVVKGNWGEVERGEADFITPVAGMLTSVRDSGATEWKKPHGNFKTEYRNEFYRGVAVKDGYVLLGHIAKDYPAFFNKSEVRPFPTPWIVKLDAKGEVLWTRELSQHEGYPITGALSELIMLDDGSLIVAAVAQVSKSAEPSTGRGGDGVRMIFFRIDADGQELQRRAILTGSAGGHLVLSSGKLIYVDKPGRFEGLKRQPESFVRARKFDLQFNLLSTRIADLGADGFWPTGAAAGESGQIYLIGPFSKNNNGNSVPVIAQIGSDDAFSVLERFPSGEMRAILRADMRQEFYVVRKNVILVRTSEGSSYRQAVIATRYRMSPDASKSAVPGEPIPVSLARGYLSARADLDPMFRQLRDAKWPGPSNADVVLLAEQHMPKLNRSADWNSKHPNWGKVKEFVEAYFRQAFETLETSNRNRPIGPQISEMFITVFASQLSLEELKSLKDFYESPVGKRFVENHSRLLLVGREAIGRFKAMQKRGESPKRDAPVDAGAMRPVLILINELLISEQALLDAVQSRDRIIVDGIRNMMRAMVATNFSRLENIWNELSTEEQKAIIAHRSSPLGIKEFNALLGVFKVLAESIKGEMTITSTVQDALLSGAEKLDNQVGPLLPR